MATTVVIVEDQALVRAGMLRLLHGQRGISVIGELSSGLEAVARVPELQPDVVLMDLSMPGMSGVEATRALLSHLPGLKVIAVSSHSSERWMRRALDAGARGYVTKDADAGALADAIRHVRAGKIYLCPRLTSSWPLGEAPVDPLSRLSPKQRVVMQMIAEGKTSRQIAGALGITERTVDTHRTKLMQRLRVNDVAGVVRMAFHLGVLEADRNDD
jgi:DNA-binding NarL/FixJ family response regulator